MRVRRDSVLWSKLIGTACITLALSILTGCISNGSLRGGIKQDSPVTVNLRFKMQDEIEAENEKYKSMNKDGKFAEEQAFHFVREESDVDPCNEFDDCSHEKILFDNKGDSADLFVVEFDDQGRLYHPEQMTHLLEFIKTAMTSSGDHCAQYEKRDESKKPCFDDISLVVAVHGWRHNASFMDRNLRELRQALYSAVKMEEEAPHLNPSDKPRKVVGVYVGWRGAFIDETTSIPLLDQIAIPFGDMSLSDAALGLFAITTFWDRKQIALDVALGSTRELFSRLGHLRTYVNEPVKTLKSKMDKNEKTAFGRSGDSYRKCREKAENPDVNGRCLPMRTLIVGHSFGSLAIYNAISASLIESVTKGIDVSSPLDPASLKKCLKNATEILSPHADLIVLVNPAFEGARYEPLYQASLNRMRTGGYSCDQHPVLAIITGTTDWATKVAFPIGRWFSTRFTSVSPKGKDGETLDDLVPQERRAERHAIGHIPRYMTHYLDIFPDRTINELFSNNEIPGENLDTRMKIYRDSVKCLTNDWRTVSHELARNASGANGLEDAIRNVYNKWNRLREQNPWSARAFCGRLRLSFALHETEEGMKDPIYSDNLLDRSDQPGPWTNQLPVSRPEPVDDRVQNNVLCTRHLYNPIWVIRTKDDRIIDGHNGYLNPYIVGFIHQLYRDAVSGSSRSIELDKKAAACAK